jgi:hypothetical protein
MKSRRPLAVRSRLLLAWLAAITLCVGCSCRPEEKVPAPTAPEAPQWNRPPPSAPPRETLKKPGKPFSARDLPASKDKPAYGLPLKIEIKAPEVPPEIRGPTPETKLKG